MVRSSFALQVGNHAQTVRVFPSTAGYTTWVVSPLGCPSNYPSTCPSDRGGTYNSNNSLTWYEQPHKQAKPRADTKAGCRNRHITSESNRTWAWTVRGHTASIQSPWAGLEVVDRLSRTLLCLPMLIPCTGSASSDSHQFRPTSPTSRVRN